MSSRTLLDGSLKLDAQFVPATITTSVVSAAEVAITNNNMDGAAQLTLANEAGEPTAWRVWNPTQGVGGLTEEGTLEFWSYNDGTDRRVAMLKKTGEVYLGDPGSTTPSVYVSGTVAGADVDGQVYDNVYNRPVQAVQGQAPSPPAFPYYYIQQGLTRLNDLETTFEAPATGFYAITGSLTVAIGDVVTPGEVIYFEVSAGTTLPGSGVSWLTTSLVPGVEGVPFTYSAPVIVPLVKDSSVAIYIRNISAGATTAISQASILIQRLG